MRVIAATNRDLEPTVREGRFREDLFYRLNVIRIQLPPLRERARTSRMLAEHFLQKHSALEGKRLELLRRRRCSGSCSTHWPGNVRELENMIERAVALSPASPSWCAATCPGQLSFERESRNSTTRARRCRPTASTSTRTSASSRRSCCSALERTGGNRTDAAKLLRHELPLAALSAREVRARRRQTLTTTSDMIGQV